MAQATRGRGKDLELTDDEEAQQKVDMGLKKIARLSHEIRRLDAEASVMREERNMLIYKLTALRQRTGGRPTVMELARANGSKHAYIKRVIEGKGRPLSGSHKT